MYPLHSHAVSDGESRLPAFGERLFSFFIAWEVCLVKLRKLKALLLALVLGLCTALPALADDMPEPADTVTIFTTNDLHGMVAGSDASIGLEQIAGIKASTPNALLIDAGDATQGASFATITQGADVIRVMNAAGYDAMAAGNHEFDYGVDQLKANESLAEFPILAANVFGTDGIPLLTEQTTIQVGGREICFIGLTTTATVTSTNPKLLNGVTFGDEIEAAGKLIDAFAPNVDAIVLVTHLGDNAAAVSCTSAQLLAALTDEQRAAVTAVIDGHSHTLENAPVDGIPVVQTGTLDTALGKLTLHFDADGAVTAEEELLDYAAAMAFPLSADGEAAAKKVGDELAAINTEQEKVLGQTLCTADTPLWGGYVYYDYAEPRIVETSYGDFVCDAFATYAEVFAGQQGMDRMPVIAVENGGGVSATLPVGTVTQGDVLTAFNHGNMVEVLKVTPAQLYAALEAGLTMTGQDETGLLLRERVSGSFLQVSGFSYAYDPAGEGGTKVTAVTLDDGTELARDDTATELLLATNCYVAASKPFAGAEKLGELGGEDLLVATYLLEATDHGTAPLSRPTTAGRITIANDQSPDTYEVAIPVEPVDDTDAAGLTVHLRIDDGEEEEYTLNGEGLLELTLDKGAHTLYLAEAADGRPVYVNNYSGSGTVTTADGYYHLGFPYDASLTAAEPEPEPTAEAPETTPAPEEEPAPEEAPAPSRAYGVVAGILVLAGVWVIVVLVRAWRRKQQKQ